MIPCNDRDLLRAIHVVADALTDGVCRATTKRAERADQFLQLRNALLQLLEGMTAQCASSVAATFADDIARLREDSADLRAEVEDLRTREQQRTSADVAAAIVARGQAVP